VTAGLTHCPHCGAEMVPPTARSALLCCPRCCLAGTREGIARVARDAFAGRPAHARARAIEELQTELRALATAADTAAAGADDTFEIRRRDDARGRASAYRDAAQRLGVLLTEDRKAAE
jgi:hypothetical protein